MLLSITVDTAAHMGGATDHRSDSKHQEQQNQ